MSRVRAFVPLPKEKPPSAVFSFPYGDLQGLDDFSRSGKSSIAALRRCPERPCAPAKSLGRFRFDREKTRKAEISRDFSAFFAPNFFRISIDPFSIFLRVEGFEHATIYLEKTTAFFYNLCYNIYTMILYRKEFYDESAVELRFFRN